ncbi:hypothetical protein GGX14DRAFT_403621 [Mycena pura]|uniref:Uncharacterized protein n=1 Tax=Mycena pura TaxID=153505 RepID=A0AAD6UVE3_9AGAR|nr:hypothetical protein GGX14DRAFT_403621 [Mycena pura]
MQIQMPGTTSFGAVASGHNIIQSLPIPRCADSNADPNSALHSPRAPCDCQGDKSFPLKVFVVSPDFSISVKNKSLVTAAASPNHRSRPGVRSVSGSHGWQPDPPLLASFNRTFLFRASASLGDRRIAPPSTAAAQLPLGPCPRPQLEKCPHSCARKLASLVRMTSTSAPSTPAKALCDTDAVASKTMIGDGLGNGHIAVSGTRTRAATRVASRQNRTHTVRAALRRT